MSTILVIDPIHEDALAALARAHDVVVHLNPSEAELVRLAADADVLVLRSGATVTRRVIEAADGLKLIARAGVGVDNIDVKAARCAGVVVCNVPDASTRAVAEFAIGLMLAVTRKIPRGDAGLRAGRWEKPALSGVELGGHTLGLVGCGRVGSTIARLAGVFGMDALAAVARPTPARRSTFAAEGIQLTSLDTVLRNADVVCLAVPLTAKTRDMIAGEQLAIMSRSAYLVNVARAEVLNAGDLYDALRTGQLAGAALDVHSAGDATAALAQLDNVVLTPHIAAMSEDAQRRVGEQLVRAIEAGLNGRQVPNRI